MITKAYKDGLFYLLALTWGIVSIVVPAMILGIEKYSHPMFPAVTNGIEGYSWLSLIFQLTGGVLLGLLNPERPWRWGVTMAAAYPTLVIFLVLTARGNSNIVLPVVLIVYAILTIPCVVGAQLGAYTRAMFKRG
jgi:energy-converting hydrogenase Eha subunit A